MKCFRNRGMFCSEVKMNKIVIFGVGGQRLVFRNWGYN